MTTGSTWLTGQYDNTIGGTTTAARNVISGNSLDGVQLSSSGAGDVIEGDFIGINANDTKALANGRSGVTIQYGSSGDFIGGTAPGDGNVISGNHGAGIWFISASGDTVEGNFIGTDSSSNNQIGNGSDGVAIEYGSTDNTIGGTTTAARQRHLGQRLGRRAHRRRRGDRQRGRGELRRHQRRRQRRPGQRRKRRGDLRGASSNTIGGTIHGRPQCDLGQRRTTAST